MPVEKNPEIFAIAWYDFKPGASVLCIEEQTDAFSSFLAKRGLSVSSASIRQCADEKYVRENKGAFDYILAAGIIERCRRPSFILRQLEVLLKDSGTLLLSTPNRLGIQYFCGDRDPFTHKAFDSIEGYRRTSDLSALNGRLYSRFEIEKFLENAGISRYKFYSVYPNLEIPQLIYSEDYLPNEDLNLRIVPRYNDPDSIFMDERHLYDAMVKNGLFHVLANGFLIECPKTCGFSGTKHATLPVFRDEASFITVIRGDGSVKKRIAGMSGVSKLQKMQEYAADLRKHGVHVLEMQVQDDSLVMPFVEAPSAVYYLRDLLHHDKDAFIASMDHFKEIIERSSEHAETPTGEVILKNGYIDLVPINAFYKDGDFVFYDQEFCHANLPAKVLLWRAIRFVYDGNPVHEQCLPSTFFIERYELYNPEQFVKNYDEPFLKKLLNKNFYSGFNRRSEQAWNSIEYNYKCINNSFADERALFDNCFNGIKGKKIYVFGAGKFTDKFLAFYRDEYNIAGILDNDPDKQGNTMRGVSVSAPDILYNEKPGEYKVIMCVNRYGSIYKQLKLMGVDDIGLYSAGHIYPGLQATVPLPEASRSGPQKKYHIGYIAGVFDLYHLGHLNMFRRAKEQCDYLVVGVTSDRYVREGKKREPFIPFGERLEMVRSCRYVDEAHEIPVEYGGTVEAFQKYHFDVQFSGSDYVHHPWWLEQQKWLREHGADLVFFPYTEQTSSTKIKALIEKGLL